MTRRPKGGSLAEFEAAMLMETDACILSTYPRKKEGYGVVWFDRRPHGAHIMACERAHGPRPEGMTASHTCGQNMCINRRHLLWETLQDNLRRRPGAAGTNNGRAKLTEDQVREIRARHAAGETPTALAREFGIAQAHTIITRRIWKHVA